MRGEAARVTRDPFFDRDFFWGPPKADLRWITVMPPGVPTNWGLAEPDDWFRYLTTGTPGLDSPRLLRRLLVEKPTLFREFAAMEPAEENILAFATEWGKLGWTVHQEIPLVDWRGTDGVTMWVANPTSATGALVPSGRGESLFRWRAEIGAMRDAVEVFDAVMAGNESVLRSLIVIEADRALVTRAVFTRKESASASAYRNIIRTPLIRSLASGERRMDAYLRAALFFLQDIVNERLRQDVACMMAYTVSPQRRALLESGTSDRARAAALRMPFDLAREPLRLTIMPLTLRGALWLQLARAIEGGIRYIRCDWCQNWIEIPRDRRLERTRFCRDVCRVNWHRHNARKRSQRARQVRRPA